VMSDLGACQECGVDLNFVGSCGPLCPLCERDSKIARLTAEVDYWKEVCEKLAAVEVREHPNYGDDYGDEGKSE